MAAGNYLVKIVFHIVLHVAETEKLVFVPKFKFTVGRCLDVFVEDDVAVAFGR